MGDWILGPGDELYSVLILHPRVFELDASGLLTFRANSAFRNDDPSVGLTVDVSDEVSGLAYIVIHDRPT